MGETMTLLLICSNGGPSLISSPAIWKQSSRMSWEISMNPDLIPHLTNHDLKPQPELGGIFNRPSVLTSPGHFSANLVVKKKKKEN